MCLVGQYAETPLRRSGLNRNNSFEITLKSVEMFHEKVTIMFVVSFVEGSVDLKV